MIERDIGMMIFLESQQETTVIGLKNDARWELSGDQHKS